MALLHIITPVKDSIDSTRLTIAAVSGSALDIPYSYHIFNDYSSEENTAILQQLSQEYAFELVNLKELTDHPSPNYRLTLQLSQERALAEDAYLLLIESDVVVKPDTLQKMYQCAQSQEKAGMVAAVTVDEKGDINFPYLYAQKWSRRTHKTNKRLSFCCTLLTPAFLKAIDFHELDPEKNWYDVFISHQSCALGFDNFLMCDNAVLHKPHGSRPWKQLKYTHPLKYYWLKFTKGLDKI